MSAPTLAEEYARNMPTEAGKLLDAYRRYVVASHRDARGWMAGTEGAARAHDAARLAFFSAVKAAPPYAIGHVFALALEAVDRARPTP